MSLWQESLRSRGVSAIPCGRSGPTRREAADDLAGAGPAMPIETAARLVYPDEDAVGRPVYYGDVPAPGIARRAPIANGEDAVGRPMYYGDVPAPGIAGRASIAMELPDHARVKVLFPSCTPGTRQGIRHHPDRQTRITCTARTVAPATSSTAPIPSPSSRARAANPLPTDDRGTLPKHIRKNRCSPGTRRSRPAPRRPGARAGTSPASPGTASRCRAAASWPPRSTTTCSARRTSPPWPRRSRRWARTRSPATTCRRVSPRFVISSSGRACLRLPARRWAGS